jgi:hypothetical protein
MARVSRRCNLISSEDLLASIGFGGVTLQQVLNRLREELRLASAAATPVLSNEDLARSVTAQADQAAPAPPVHRTEAGSASPIIGLEGLEYRLGRIAATSPRCRWSAVCRCAGTPWPTTNAAATRFSCASKYSIGWACSKTSSPASPTIASM